MLASCSLFPVDFLEGHGHQEGIWEIAGFRRNLSLSQVSKKPKWAVFPFGEKPIAVLWGPEHAHGPSASNLQRLPRMVGPLGPLTWGSSSSAVETDSRSGAVNSLSLHPMLPPGQWGEFYCPGAVSAVWSLTVEGGGGRRVSFLRASPGRLTTGCRIWKS